MCFKKKKKKRSPQRRRLYSGGGQMSLSTGERRGDQVAPVSAWGSQEGTEPPHPTRRWAGPLSYKRPLGDGHIAGGGCRAASEEATPGGEEPLGNPEGVRPGGSPVRGRGSSPVRGRGWSPVRGSGAEGARFGVGGGARFGVGGRPETPGAPGPAGASWPARRSLTRPPSPGGPVGRGRARPNAAASRDPRAASRWTVPAWSHQRAPPRLERTISAGCGGGGAAASAALQVGSGLNASVCLLLVEEFYPEGLTKDTIM